jgi:hypothetical protein
MAYDSLHVNLMEPSPIAWPINVRAAFGDGIGIDIGIDNAKADSPRRMA